jgi:hypothetical protein
MTTIRKKQRRLPLPSSADLKRMILDVRLFVLWDSLFLLVFLILL